MKNPIGLIVPVVLRLRQLLAGVVLRLRQLLAGWMTPGIFIGTLALLTSVWSGVATRTNYRLAARPHFAIAELFSHSSPRLGFVGSNLGPGIAIIDDFQIYLDRHPEKGDWREQLDQFRKSENKKGCDSTESWTTIGGFQKGEALATSGLTGGETLLIVDESKFGISKDPDQWAKKADCLREIVKDLRVNIRYHSVYGERFEIDKQGLQPATFRRRWLFWWLDWQP